jgi:MFS family permease
MTILDTYVEPSGQHPVVVAETGAPRPEPARHRPALRGHVGVRGWLLAVAVYVTAVFHRSSLGVAGLDAGDRFGISAGQLSVFVLLQLGVYAAMQVPTGILVDRFGPRRLLIAAASTMAVAQLLFAVAPSYPSALAARALLGCGDALTFVSVLRFAAQHFSARRYPVIVALTGTLGAMGNIVATMPLSASLDALGWTPSFAIAAATSAIVALTVWQLMPRESSANGGMPPVALRRPLAEWRPPVRRVVNNVAAAWATSGTRAGFWLHFSTMSFTTMFGVLWGVPYLVSQGYSRSSASAVLMLGVASGVVASPVVGTLFGRHRPARVPFALGVAFVTIAGWSAIVFGFGEQPPHALLLVMVAITAVGGPASGIGFSLARDYNEPSLVGTASGVVNVGGFTASIIAAVGVGRVLDLVGDDDAAAFRLAFAMAIAVQAVGAILAVRWYRRLRARVLDAQERGEPVPVPAVRHRWDLATW